MKRSSRARKGSRRTSAPARSLNRSPSAEALKYHINVFYSAEDSCFIADVPDLKYCTAHGPTPEKALKEVLVAMDGWLAVAKELGKRIPKPRYRPAIDNAA